LTLRFFASWPWDPYWIAEGEVLLSAQNVTTDSSGNASVDFSTTAPSWLTSDYLITATATDPAGNTSGFSSSAPLSVGPQSVSLSIGGSGGTVTVSWPSAATAAGCLLEATPSLAPAQWQTVATGILNDGTLCTLSLTNGSLSANQFFRLRKP
jgi:hypothetical protein